MTGADLRNLANEAALLATREGKNKIDRSRLRARRRPRADRRANAKKCCRRRRSGGRPTTKPATPSVRLADAEERTTMFKITIIPRGQSLGMTRFRPEEDRTRLHADSNV